MCDQWSVTKHTVLIVKVWLVAGLPVGSKKEMGVPIPGPTHVEANFSWACFGIVELTHEFSLNVFNPLVGIVTSIETFTNISTPKWNKAGKYLKNEQIN